MVLLGSQEVTVSDKHYGEPQWVMTLYNLPSFADKICYVLLVMKYGKGSEQSFLGLCYIL